MKRTLDIWDEKGGGKVRCPTCRLLRILELERGDRM